MRNILITFGALLFFSGALYLIVAFCSASFDPGQWHEAVRFFFGLALSMSLTVTVYEVYELLTTRHKNTK